MRVNRIGLVTSLSLHHQHHHPRHHYYCRHVNRIKRIGIETSFLLQKEQSFQWNPRTHNDNMIFRCFIFQTFYSRPVRFFFLAGTGIVAKNALFVMFWELRAAKPASFGPPVIFAAWWKNQIRFPTFGGSPAACWVVKFSLLPKFIRSHAVKEIW